MTETEENEIIERCARVCELMPFSGNDPSTNMARDIRADCANQIRALKQPQPARGEEQKHVAMPDITRSLNERERNVLGRAHPNDFGIPQEHWEAAKSFGEVFHSQNLISLARAREILGEAVQEDGSLRFDGITAWLPGIKLVALRGRFTALQLEAIATVMRERMSDVMIQLCPPMKACEHVFDGPEVPIYSPSEDCYGKPEMGCSVTCSKCGITAYEHSLWTLP